MSVTVFLDDVNILTSEILSKVCGVQDAPTIEIINPKMLIVLRLRNPALRE